MRLNFYFLMAVALVASLAFVSATPSINPIGDKNVSENSSLSFLISLSNGNINSTIFTGTSAPAMNGAVLTRINDSLAAFNWTPGFTDSGIYNVSFTAQDIINLCPANQTCSNSSDTQNITITVSDLNFAPVFNPIANQTVNQGTNLQFTISATDPDGGALGYAASNLPSGASFSPSTRTFSWTPSAQQSGTFQVVFTVSDGTFSDSETVSIIVNQISANLSSSALVFGGNTQQRSNPRSDVSSNENVIVSSSFTVTNTGPDQISGLSVASITPVGGFGSSSTNITLLSISQSSINPGESATLTFSARIPETLDAIDPNTLGERTFDVASIIVRGISASGTQVSKSVTASMQARNNLRIKDVRIVGSNGDSKSIGSDDTVKNIKPGDTLSLEVNVENRFSSNDNVDLEDIEVTAVNDDLDLDESETISSIAPRKTKTATMRFSIPDDIENDDYEVTIEAEGDDENGAAHGQRFRFTIEIERPDHEISITRAELDPSSISCESSTELRIAIRNTGSNEEDATYLRIASPDLKFSQVVGPFDLDEDQSRSSTFSIPILPNLSVGSKRITVESFYEGDQLSDRKTVLLSLSRCEATAPAPVSSQNQSVVVVPQPKEPAIAETPAQQPTGFTDSPYYIPLLVIANLILLGAAIFIVGKLLSR